jgi:hypothetical protein
LAGYLSCTDSLINPFLNRDDRAITEEPDGKRLGIPVTDTTPSLTIKHATTHNLKDITVTFPLGIMVGVAGASERRAVARPIESLPYQIMGEISRQQEAFYACTYMGAGVGGDRQPGIMQDSRIRHNPSKLVKLVPEEKVSPRQDDGQRRRGNMSLQSTVSRHRPSQYGKTDESRIRKSSRTYLNVIFI